MGEPGDCLASASVASLVERGSAGCLARRRLNTLYAAAHKGSTCTPDAVTLCHLYLPRLLPMKIRPILFCALFALPMSVFASSFAGTSAGSASGASSNSSGSSSGDDKVVLEAREDAAGFVASNGAIRGAWLEAALIHLREKDVAARDASDMELARKILAL